MLANQNFGHTMDDCRTVDAITLAELNTIAGRTGQITSTLGADLARAIDPERTHELKVRHYYWDRAGLMMVECDCLVSTTRGIHPSPSRLSVDAKTFIALPIITPIQ